MKYLVRTLITLVFIPGVVILGLGIILSIILSVLQIPLWFIMKGEFLDVDDSVLAWYLENIMDRVFNIWGKMLKWSRE